MKTIAMCNGSPIRILKVVTAFGRGGTEGQVLNLARSLDPSQFALQLSCLRRGGNVLEEFEALKVPIAEFRIDSLYKPKTFMQQLRFASFLREQRIQILHSYNFYSNMFALPAARLAGVPVVLASIRDQGVYLNPSQMTAQKYICRLADRILVNADSIREWLLEEGFKENKVNVIRNGIDISRYGNRQVNIPLRQELGIPDSSPIIVLLSRLNPQKGISEFIRAASLLSPKHPEARFLIVGSKYLLHKGKASVDRQYFSELQQLAIDLGVGDKVIFAGHRTDTIDILSTSTISVLPSHSEGLSNSLLESMAAGIPVIATNVGGNPELVKDNVNGFLVPVNAPRQLADAIGSILNNPKMGHRFGEKARSIAKEKFSLDKMTADTQALYLNELERKKGICTLDTGDLL